jgi:hypothetical protein
MPAAARLYSPQQQQTCWHRTALDGNDTVLVDEDLKPENLMILVSRFPTKCGILDVSSPHASTACYCGPCRTKESIRHFFPEFYISPTTAAPTYFKSNLNKSFTRRTSGHCLRTFQTAKLCFDYTPLQNGSLSHYPPPQLSSLSLSLSQNFLLCVY